ncbi:MAG: hypothetical protein PHX70_00755 [Clostridium sp.]|nr:hypothetical protein [Clostridium sp.]
MKKKVYKNRKKFNIENIIYWFMHQNEIIFGETYGRIPMWSTVVYIIECAIITQIIFSWHMYAYHIKLSVGIGWVVVADIIFGMAMSGTALLVLYYASYFGLYKLFDIEENLPFMKKYIYENSKFDVGYFGKLKSKKEAKVKMRKLKKLKENEEICARKIDIYLYKYKINTAKKVCDKGLKNYGSSINLMYRKAVIENRLENREEALEVI